jgi:hydroxymethylbilane synthase
MTDDIPKIRLGTRASRLALSQVAEVSILISDFFPQIKIEIVPITTSGDKILNRNLAEIGGKGLFIKELEEALIQNKIDVAVHSAKDVPPIIHDQTIIGAFTPRNDARDCFVSKKFDNFKKLPKGAVIGTSSVRRKAFLLRYRPDLQVVNFRGNIDTRLNKIDENEVDAIILAVSGLVRLAKEQHIKEVLDENKFIPAGGQGALALQIRKNDHKLTEILSKINDEISFITIKTERAFLRQLNASCSTPIGVYSYIKNNKLHLKIALINYDGTEIYEKIFTSKVNLDDGIKLGIEASNDCKKNALNLLKKIGCIV